MNRPPTAAERITLDNFQQHPLFTANVELLRPGDPLRATAAPGLAIGDVDDPRNALGRGSFGAVIRGVASHPHVGGGDAGGGDAGDEEGQAVAVKMVHAFINPGLYGLTVPAAWNHTVADLMDEINSVHQLQHPHVVRLHCFGLQTVLGVGLPGYVALQLCTEGTLEEWIQRDRFGGTDVATFTQHLIDAVHYLHGLRIVHRDIKPANIFIDRRRANVGPRETQVVVVIGDLGSAKAVRDTIRGASGGGFTTMYLAPEVFGTQTCTFSSDVYAVGCVVVEMLTRTSVFSADLAAAQAAGPAAPLQVVAAAKEAARRDCAAAAVQVATTIAVADDCWATPAMMCRLVRTVAEEQGGRCTMAELFALGESRRERLVALEAAARDAAQQVCHRR